jgi:hypothetical protein
MLSLLVANHHCDQRRQTLREHSFQDSPNWRAGAGPVSTSSFRRSNGLSTPVGGPVRSNGTSQAQVESYGTPAFDSPERSPRNRGQSGAQQSGVSFAGASVPMSLAVQAMIAAGK